MRLTDFFEDSKESELVKQLQVLLNRKGAQLEVSGELDPKTAEAVKTYFPALYDKVATMPGKPSSDTSVAQKTTLNKKTSLDNIGDIAKEPAKKSTSSPQNSFKDTDFIKKLRAVSKSLGVDPEDLAAIIHMESRGRADAVNKFDVSVGLIGFTETTARSLGTTKDRIKQMPAIDQLDLVEKFYRRAGVKTGMNRAQLYMLTFLPAFVNAPDNTVLGRENGGNLQLPNGSMSKLSMHKIWLQNPVFSKKYQKNHFTVGDVKRTILAISAPSLSEDMTEDSINPVDTVQLDVPLLLRMMEYAREDAKTDMDLHDVTEKMIHLSKTGETLSMAQYDDIVSDNGEPESKPTMPSPEPAQQESMGGSSAEEFLKSVEYRPRHQTKPKRTLMGDPVREGHGRYWCSTDKRWKERQGPKQSRS